MTDTPNIPNYTEPGFCPKRDEKAFCPHCGYLWAWHDYIPSSATEPEEYICPKDEESEFEPFNPFDDNSHDLPRKSGDWWENLDIQF